MNLNTEFNEENLCYKSCFYFLFCFSCADGSRLIIRYFFAYMPMLVVLILNPVFLWSTQRQGTSQSNNKKKKHYKWTSHWSLTFTIRSVQLNMNWQCMDWSTSLTDLRAKMDPSYPMFHQPSMWQCYFPFALPVGRHRKTQKLMCGDIRMTYLQ